MTKVTGFRPIFIKTDVKRYPGIEETVLPLVKEAPLAKPVIFSSFNLASLLVAQSIDPGFEYCYLTDRNLKDPDAFCQREFTHTTI
ncbi:PI-PLC domain-containing protein [Limosilactobacillus fermentum]|uniref:hypothetical protein n=1 Tax=Limosilactobacillus fermentum TaxID=1613 RepID=UPI001CD8BC01|nr:hypothetical protein [Limosilactobacillus fermentum]